MRDVDVNTICTVRTAPYSGGVHPLSRCLPSRTDLNKYILLARYVHHGLTLSMRIRIATDGAGPSVCGAFTRHEGPQEPARLNPRCWSGIREARHHGRTRRNRKKCADTVSVRFGRNSNAIGPQRIEYLICFVSFSHVTFIFGQVIVRYTDCTTASCPNFT